MLQNSWQRPLGYSKTGAEYQSLVIIIQHKIIDGTDLGYDQYQYQPYSQHHYIGTININKNITLHSGKLARLHGKNGHRNTCFAHEIW